MKDQNKIETLKQDIEIPDIVTNKAEETLMQIRSNYQNSFKNKKRFRFSGIAAASVALALVTITGVTAATASHWSNGLKDFFHVSAEQEIELDENEPDLVSYELASASDKGITITAKQAICDGNHMDIALKVEGLSISEKSGDTPDCDMVNVKLDGIETSAGWSFDNGLTWVGDTLYYYDGTPAEKNGDEVVPKYQQNDGSYELNVHLDSNNGKKLNGQTIQIAIHALGSYGGAKLANPIEGNWVLSWKIKGNDTIRNTVPKESITIGAASIKSFSLSSIGMVVTYDYGMSLEDLAKKYPDKEDSDQIFPQVAGIRMNDGTTYLSILNSSRSELDEENHLLHESIHSNRILQPEEIKSILFIDPEWFSDNGNEPTEKDCIEVELQ